MNEMLRRRNRVSALYEAERRIGMYIITAKCKGRRVTRTAFSDFQAFTIIGMFHREGCTDIGMREEEEHESDVYGKGLAGAPVCV